MIIYATKRLVMVRIWVLFTGTVYIVSPVLISETKALLRFFSFKKLINNIFLKSQTTAHILVSYQNKALPMKIIGIKFLKRHYKKKMSPPYMSFSDLKFEICKKWAFKNCYFCIQSSQNNPAVSFLPKNLKRQKYFEFN